MRQGQDEAGGRAHPRQVSPDTITIKMPYLFCLITHVTPNVHICVPVVCSLVACSSFGSNLRNADFDFFTFRRRLRAISEPSSCPFPPFFGPSRVEADVGHHQLCLGSCSVLVVCDPVRQSIVSGTDDRVNTCVPNHYYVYVHFFRSAPLPSNSAPLALVGMVLLAACASGAVHQ